MDIHDVYKNAVRSDPQLIHVGVVHDPFHVMTRANEAVDDLRRSVFFRARAEQRPLIALSEASFPARLIP